MVQWSICTMGLNRTPSADPVLTNQTPEHQEKLPRFISPHLLLAFSAPHSHSHPNWTRSASAVELYSHCFWPLLSTEAGIFSRRKICWSQWLVRFQSLPKKLVLSSVQNRTGQPWSLHCPDENELGYDGLFREISCKLHGARSTFYPGTSSLNRKYWL